MQARLYDRLLSEYGGYTVDTIEGQLSWEQVFMLTDAMTERYNPEEEEKRSSSSSRRPARPNSRVREFTLEEVIQGQAPKGLANMAVKEGSE